MLIDTNKIKKFCRKKGKCEGCPFNSRDVSCWAYGIIYGTNRLTQAYRKMEKLNEN